MFPWSHDFTFDAGHLVFLGAFYLVLLVIAVSVAGAADRAVRGAAARGHRGLR